MWDGERIRLWPFSRPWLRLTDADYLDVYLTKCLMTPWLALILLFGCSLSRFLWLLVLICVQMWNPQEWSAGICLELNLLWFLPDWVFSGWLSVDFDGLHTRWFLAQWLGLRLVTTEYLSKQSSGMWCQYDCFTAPFRVWGYLISNCKYEPLGCLLHITQREQTRQRHTNRMLHCLWSCYAWGFVDFPNPLVCQKSV